MPINPSTLDPRVVPIFERIRDLILAGHPASVAIDTVMGCGAFERLAGQVYDCIRSKHGIA